MKVHTKNTQKILKNMLIFNGQKCTFLTLLKHPKIDDFWPILMLFI